LPVKNSERDVFSLNSLAMSYIGVRDSICQ